MSLPKGKFGLVALVLGVVALGLAVVPGLVFGVPPPWPTEPAGPKQVVEGGTTYQWKGVQVTVGGETKDVEPEPPPPAARWFAAATAVVALLGIGIGTFAYWRERSYGLALPGMTLCCVALVWHFILLGVAAAIAVTVLIAFLRSTVT